MINATLAVAVALSAGVVTVARSWQRQENKENLQSQAVSVENYTPLETTTSIAETLPPLSTEKEATTSKKSPKDEQISETVGETPKSDAPNVRYALTGEERREIERMIASEGGYCPYEFQALVATCILNICEADELRPLEVFERGDFWITHNIAPTETTKQAVSDVFDKGILPTEEKIRAYYNPNYCSSPYHETLCYVLTSSDCRFFKCWE